MQNEAIVSILTGERTHFLIRACGGLLASIVWKPKLMMFSALVLIEISAVVTVFLVRPDLSNNFTQNFVKMVIHLINNILKPAID